MQEFLQKGKFGYQKIQLPYGLETKGDDRSSTRDAIFPDDMTGKTILDIGSLNGYFCFEALKRGAKTAVGIEVNPWYINEATLLADCLGLHAKFRLVDIEKDMIEGQFDYVLCLNVLHHLRDPIAALDKLIALTRERLILEVASIGGAHDRHKLKISRIISYLLSRYPLLYVEEINKKKRGQKFFITPQAVKNLLLSHRNMFASVQILPSEHKNRSIAIAYKRRIKKMLVVSGPTSSGKSTLVKKLLAGTLPQLEEKLGLTDISTWKSTSAGRLGTLTEAYIERLIFEYDFNHVHFKSAGTYDRHEPLDILDCTEELIILSLWTPPAVLLTQFERAVVFRGMKRGVFRGNKRKKAIYEIYKDPTKVYHNYKIWFDFCARRPCLHYIILFSDGLQIYSSAEWEEKAGAYGLP